MDNQSQRIEDLRNIKDILLKKASGEKYKYENTNENIKEILLTAKDKTNSELAYFYNERLKLVQNFSSAEHWNLPFIKNIVELNNMEYLSKSTLCGICHFAEGSIDIELYNECCSFLLRDSRNQSYYTLSIMLNVFNGLKIKEKEIAKQTMQLLEEAIVFLLVLSRRLGFEFLAINPYGV